MGRLFKLVFAGLGLAAVAEVGKVVYDRYLKRVAMINGHAYALAFDYTKNPPAPVNTALVQSILDGKQPGTFNVLSANMTPGPASGIRQMAVVVELVGATASFPVTDFTTGWPVTFGKVTLAQANDNGTAQGVA